MHDIANYDRFRKATNLPSPANKFIDFAIADIGDMFNWKSLDPSNTFCTEGELLYGKFNNDSSTDLLCFYKDRNLM